MKKRHLGRTSLLLLLALLVGGFVALRTDWAGDKVCEVARSRLPGLLKMDVELARCRIDPLRGGVELFGVSLGRPGTERPLLAADRLLVRVRAFDVITGRVRLERIEIERPRLSLDLTPTEGPRPAKKKGCVLDDLRRIAVDSVAVSGAELHLSAPEGRSARFEDLEVDLHLSGRTYAARLSAPRGSVDTGNVKVPLSRMRFATSLNLDDQKLVLNKAEAAAGDLSVFVQGNVESLCRPNPSLEASVFAPLDLVSAMLGSAVPPMRGTAAIALKLEGLEEPSVEAEVTLSRVAIGGYEVGDAYLEGRLEKDVVRIDRLDVAVGDRGQVRAQATIGLGDGVPVEGTVELKQVEFGRVLDKLGVDHAWVNFAATGSVEVRGGLAPFRLAGPASLDVEVFRLFDRGFDRPKKDTLLQFDAAHLDLQTDFNSQRAQLSRARLKTDRSELDVDATLNFNSEKGLDIEVGVQELDLADLGHLLGIPWGGQIAGRGRIRGPYGKPEITATVSGRDLAFHALKLGNVQAEVHFLDNLLRFPAVVALKGRSRFNAAGELDFRGRQPEGRGRGSFENARLSDLIEAIGDEYWLFDLLRDRAEARIHGTATVEGPIAAPRADIAVTLAETTYYDRQLGSGEFVFRARDAQFIAIDRLEFDGPCGQLSFDGRVDFDQGLDFEIRAPKLFLSELAKPDAVFLDAGGTLSVEARLFGPSDRTRLEGQVDARGVSLFGALLGDGDLALQLDRTHLSLRGPLGPDLLLDARMVIEGELPFGVGVTANTETLERYLPAEWGLTGALTGDLLASGTIERYEQTRGDLLLSSLRLTKGGYSLRSDGAIDLGFAGAALDLRNLALRGPSGARLSAWGTRAADGVLDLSVDGAFDVRALESLVPFVEQTGGRVQVSASLAGPASAPTVVGHAEVEGGQFSVRGFPVSVQGIRGDLEFSQNKLFLADVEGAMNGGRVVVRGDVELKDFTAERLDLGMVMEGVQLRYPANVPSTFDGEVRLQGTLDDLLLAGDLDLVRLRYSEDLDAEGMLKDTRRRHLEAKTFEKKDEFLRFDLLVHVLDDALIDNNLVKTALRGDLRVVGTNLHPGVLGTLSAPEGGRAFFRGNEFSLSRVAVDLTQRDRIAPVIDVHAESVVRDYRILVHAYGAAEDPQVDLTSDPELPRADIVTLLTLGFTSQDTGASTASASAGLVGETLFSMSGLDKQVKKFIPENTILRDFSFHLSTQYSEVSGMVEPTTQFESRLLTDSLKLRLSQPVISGKGRRAQAEYKFNKYVSAQAQWDIDSVDPKYSAGDLGLDLKLRWELD